MDINEVNDLRSESAASLADETMRSLSIWGRRASRPPADPGGKDRIAASTSFGSKAYSVGVISSGGRGKTAKHFSAFRSF